MFQCLRQLNGKSKKRSANKLAGVYVNDDGYTVVE